MCPGMNGDCRYRKADSYVKLNVKMEDYYRIKDAEGGEADG